MASVLLCERGRFAEAVEAALLAVHADPLRESAQRALIAVHLEEGNVVEARRVFARYRRVVLAELGVEPSATIRALVTKSDGLPPRASQARAPMTAGEGRPYDTAASLRG